MEAVIIGCVVYGIQLGWGCVVQSLFDLHALVCQLKKTTSQRQQLSKITLSLSQILKILSGIRSYYKYFYVLWFSQLWSIKFCSLVDCTDISKKIQHKSSGKTWRQYYCFLTKIISCKIKKFNFFTFSIYLLSNINL